jgi:pyruvate/2-oxoglutarate dehydrogenase complex dihydrolipoamide dehydrogenase (E3) component
MTMTTAILPPEEAAKRYTTLQSGRYDLLILGGGSAGLVAAELASAFGAKVALVDRSRLGGECLYTGCVPSKALLHCARLAVYARRWAAHGADARKSVTDFAAVMNSVRHAIDDIYRQSDNPERFVAKGVEVAIGETRFVGRDRLSVNGKEVFANRVFICTGSHSLIPSIAGLERSDFLTNETVFDLRELPSRLTILGGGPVGCELGQAFARLGAQVTILQRADRLLPKEDPAASALLRARLVAEGMTIHTRAAIDAVERRGSDTVVLAHVDDAPQEVVCDRLFVAVGRGPNVDGLSLDVAGVRADARSGIVVDKRLRTSNPRVYAGGDVIGGYRFTHAAALHARVAVRNALFLGATELDQRVMPQATFTDPEVARVGLGEEEARRRHGSSVRTFVQSFTGVDRAITDEATEGFVKLVSAKDGAVLGAQIVGPGAGDYINEVALAMQQHLGVDALASTTHVYPTLALAIQQAAGQYAIERTRRNPFLGFLRRRS